LSDLAKFSKDTEHHAPLSVCDSWAYCMEWRGQPSDSSCLAALFAVLQFSCTIFWPWWRW